MGTRLSSGVPGCNDTKRNLISSSSVQTRTTWLQGQEFTVPAQTAPSWKGHTGTASTTRGAALKAPRITLGLHTPLLHSEGMNSVFW